MRPRPSSREADDQEWSGPLSGGLGRRLLGWLLLFSVLPLLGSNMLGYLQSQEIIERLVHRQLGAIAEVEAQHVRDQLNRSLLELQAIAAANEFLVSGARRMQGDLRGVMADVADVEAIREHLIRKRDELQSFEQLYLLHPDGSVAVASGALPNGGESFRPSDAPPPRFEALHEAGADGGSRFRLTVPIVGLAGEQVGYLAGLMGPDQFSVFLEIPEHLAGSIESFVVDAAGRPLFVSHPHGPVDHDAPLRSPALAGPAGDFSRYTDRQGVDVIGTSVGIGDLDWRFLAEFPVQDALGPLRELRQLSLILAGVLVLLLVVSAWFVSGGIVAPIRELVAATRKVGGGDFDVRVDVDEGDEIGELEKAFNEMTEQLAETSARVQELHQREIERAHQLATVGELASGVAHEIKNPVVGISNGLDLVRRRIGEDEGLDPIMEEMGRQLSRIEEAVRDLLAFARPGTPTLEAVDANEMAERAARLVEPAAQQAGVELTMELAPDLPRQQADEELIRQALVNLMMNAVQATGPGGRVTVSTEGRDACVVFRVADTGPGIPPDLREDVFKPFFTTRARGTGLGLSITREVVDRHGGTLEMETEVGEGTTFTVCLPVSPEEEPCPGARVSEETFRDRGSSEGARGGTAGNGTDAAGDGTTDGHEEGGGP